MRSVKTILCYIFIGVAMATPMMHLNGLFSRELIVLYSFIASSIAAAVVILVSFHKNHKTYLSISTTDILVAVFFLIGLLNIALIDNFEIDPITYFKWITIGILYMLFRTFYMTRYTEEEQVIIPILLSFAGIIQALLAITQYFGWTTSNHSMFDITGSFGNPGQLGGFIAVTTIISLGLFNYFAKQKINKILSIVIVAAIIVQSIALLLANSRAGIIGLLAGAAFLYSHYLIAVWSKHKLIFVISCITVLILGGYLIYSFRPASADARLLIWRVGLNMVADKPIFGQGVGSFAKEYMLYQAGFFKMNPDSQFAMVADNVAYPYNELLHVSIELGIIGLLMIVGLFLSVFLYKAKNYNQMSLKAGLVCLMTFSMFSYPSYVLPLLCLFPLLFGSLNSKIIYRYSKPKWGYTLMLVILALFGVFSVSELRYYKYAAKNATTFFSQNTDNTKIIEYINDNFDKLKYSPQFNFMYSEWLINNGSLSKVIYLRDDFIPSCETYCYIGNVYFKNSDYQKAEKYYIIASQMIPTRMKPSYYLWEMYNEIGDTVKAKQMAERTLYMPLKVENTFTLRAKAEIRRTYLK